MNSTVTQIKVARTASSVKRRTSAPRVQLAVVFFVVMFLASFFLKPFLASYLPAPTPQMHPWLKAFLGANGLLSFVLALCAAQTALSLDTSINWLRNRGTK